MRGKEFFKSMLMDFFIIVTLVNVAIYILGNIFIPENTFGYEAFLSPLIYGFFSLIPEAIMYSKKELTVKELLVRKALQLLAIEVILIFITFGFSPKDHGDWKLILAFALSVLIIYVLVHVVGWLLDRQTAQKMMKDLQSYQESMKDN